MNNKSTLLIKGERNTGSNWIRQLITTNFQNIHFLQDRGENTNNYGSKHECLKEENIENINNKNIIMVVVIKDVFYWLVSMYRKTYANKFDRLIQQTNMSFSDFIRHKYSYKYYIGGIIEQAENLIKLREKKNLNWVNANVNKKYIINYDNAKEELINIANKENINLNDKWDDVNKYTKPKVQADNFVKKSYDEVMKNYSKDDIQFVLSNLNMEFEKSYGLNYDYVNNYL